MKKICIVFIFVILLYWAPLFASTNIACVPSRISVGGRPLGMGKDFVADDTGDINSIFLNPAGLARLNYGQATSLSGKFLDEVNYFNIAIAAPSSIGVI